MLSQNRNAKIHNLTIINPNTNEIMLLASINDVEEFENVANTIINSFENAGLYDKHEWNSTINIETCFVYIKKK